MSMAALLVAARDVLRANNSWTENQCDIQLDGRPPETAGEFYVGIDEGSISSRVKQIFLEEEFGLEVYVWRRGGLQPRDKWKNLYLDNLNGLEVIERRVIQSLHGSETVRAEANEVLTEGDNFDLPLYYTGRSKTGTQSIETARGATPWLVRVLHFRGGLRIQALSVMK